MSTVRLCLFFGFFGLGSSGRRSWTDSYQGRPAKLTGSRGFINELETLLPLCHRWKCSQKRHGKKKKKTRVRLRLGAAAGVGQGSARSLCFLGGFCSVSASPEQRWMLTHEPPDFPLL